jgi:hypothetical protein
MDAFAGPLLLFAARSGNEIYCDGSITKKPDFSPSVLRYRREAQVHACIVYSFWNGASIQFSEPVWLSGSLSLCISDTKVYIQSS